MLPDQDAHLAVAESLAVSVSEEGQRQRRQYKEYRAQFQKRPYDALPWWQRLWRRITGHTGRS
jgi:hypothetical protein